MHSPQREDGRVTSQVCVHVHIVHGSMAMRTSTLLVCIAASSDFIIAQSTTGKVIGLQKKIPRRDLP